MIQEFIDLFTTNKAELELVFKKKHPEDYKDVVKTVISALHTGEDISIDPERIHEIDDGDYQGTLVYIIANNDYQTNEYWYVKVGYGSCSGCDTLKSINDGDYDNLPTDEQVKDYMTLALHIVQGLKKIE